MIIRLRSRAESHGSAVSVRETASEWSAGKYSDQESNESAESLRNEHIDGAALQKRCSCSTPTMAGPKSGASEGAMHILASAVRTR